MSKVLAKFHLESCQPYYETGHQDELEHLTGAQVTFNAVKGEPFGPWTPFGRIQMTILNPAAAVNFVQPWQSYTIELQKWSASGGKIDAPEYPQFYVIFQADNERGLE